MQTSFNCISWIVALSFSLKFSEDGILHSARILYSAYNNILQEYMFYITLYLLHFTLTPHFSKIILPGFVFFCIDWLMQIDVHMLVFTEWTGYWMLPCTASGEGHRSSCHHCSPPVTTGTNCKDTRRRNITCCLPPSLCHRVRVRMVRQSTRQARQEGTLQQGTSGSYLFLI